MPTANKTNNQTAAEKHFDKAASATAKASSSGGFGKWLIELAKNKKEARTNVEGMLRFSAAPDGHWRGIIAVPPASPIERVLSAFKTETDIPLELPFFTMLHFVSGWLLSQKVKLTVKGKELYPELWTIILADSGAGKTLAHNIIAKEAPVKSVFPEPASGAAFIDALSQKNFSLWFQDEIAQKLKQIESPGTPLSDVKEYLLRAYGNDKIERSTRGAGTVSVDEPCLGILGLNTPESFFKAISQESLLDGFAQRFAYVVAARDPDRSVETNPEKYAIYNETALRNAARSAFDKLVATPVHTEYKVGDKGEEAFRVAFALLLNKSCPVSFYRRIMWRAFRYALLYHVILGKSSNVIDDEDIGWGARVAYMHLQDVKVLLRGKNPQAENEFGVLEKMVAKAEEVKKRIEAQGGKFTHRDIQQGVRGIKTADEAKALMSFLA